VAERVYPTDGMRVANRLYLVIDDLDEEDTKQFFKMAVSVVECVIDSASKMKQKMKV
jgi:hypothetical protein